MTLADNLSDLFDRLELWFEATVGHISCFYLPTLKDGPPPRNFPFI